MKVRFPGILWVAVLQVVPAISQTKAVQNPPHDELKYVVYVTRHGIRSPTGKPSQYDRYSTAPWPTWDVPPGNLTSHGFDVMQNLGSYDRMLLRSQGLLVDTACANALRVTIYADSDQRTRETGKALAQGLFPGCGVNILGSPEGQGDPLFHPPASSISATDAALAVAAIAGRIGDTPSSLALAYHTPLAALDKILLTCGKPASEPHERTSIFDVPSSLGQGSKDHAAELHGPLNTASTLTENLLLEYVQGMDRSDVGWGCVDGDSVRSLIDLHTAASDIAQRTPTIARLQASALLSVIADSLERAIVRQPKKHTPGKPTDLALFLIGHDTNLSNLAGALNLNWMADGRRDDTPPGSTLMFELWRSKTGLYSVCIYFMTETLEQMRTDAELTMEHPPERVPVFVSGCSRQDFSCSWTAFSRILHVSTLAVSK